MARIELKDVRKVYGGNIEAIKGVSLDIEDGAMIVLVGPSGCGKSTLLRTNGNAPGPLRAEVQVAAVELVGAESYVHALTADAARFHLFDAAGKRV